MKEIKIPASIANKMHKIAKANLKSQKLTSEVNGWFERNGFNIDLLRSGSGITLDELDYGIDVTNELVSDIEANPNRYKGNYRL